MGTIGTLETVGTFGSVGTVGTFGTVETVGTGGPVGPVGTVDTVGCSIASTELCELVQEHNLIFMHKKFNLIRPALHVSGEKIHIFAILST